MPMQSLPTAGPPRTTDFSGLLAGLDALRQARQHKAELAETTRYHTGLLAQQKQGQGMKTLAYVGDIARLIDDPQARLGFLIEASKTPGFQAAAQAEGLSVDAALQKANQLASQPKPLTPEQQTTEWKRQWFTEAGRPQPGATLPPSGGAGFRTEVTPGMSELEKLSRLLAGQTYEKPFAQQMTEAGGLAGARERGTRQAQIETPLPPTQPQAPFIWGQMSPQQQTTYIQGQAEGRPAAEKVPPFASAMTQLKNAEMALALMDAGEEVMTLTPGKKGQPPTYELNERRLGKWEAYGGMNPPYDLGSVEMFRRMDRAELVAFIDRLRQAGGIQTRGTSADLLSALRERFVPGVYEEMSDEQLESRALAGDESAMTELRKRPIYKQLTGGK